MLTGSNIFLENSLVFLGSLFTNASLSSLKFKTVPCCNTLQFVFYLLSQLQQNIEKWTYLTNSQDLLFDASASNSSRKQYLLFCSSIALYLYFCCHRQLFLPHLVVIYSHALSPLLYCCTIFREKDHVLFFSTVLCIQYKYKKKYYLNAFFLSLF